MRCVCASKGAIQFRVPTAKNTAQSYRNSAKLEDSKSKKFEQEREQKNPPPCPPPKGETKEPTFTLKNENGIYNIIVNRKRKKRETRSHRCTHYEMQCSLNNTSCIGFRGENLHKQKTHWLNQMYFKTIYSKHNFSIKTPKTH